MRGGALVALVMSAASVCAAARGVGVAGEVAPRAPSPKMQMARQAQPEPGIGSAHPVLRRTLLGLAHRPSPAAVTAKRQVAYHATPGHGALGGPTARPAVMALSGVRRRP
jgi:hypothetical protein